MSAAAPPGVACPGCGARSRRHTVFLWPPRPNSTDLPVASPRIPNCGTWRCLACVRGACYGGYLQRRLRTQRRLIAAGAMRWPRADE